MAERDSRFNLELEVDSSVIETLNHYLDLGDKFDNPPQVKLSLISANPEGEIIGARSVAASTAIQCYSSGAAHMAERTKDWEIGVAESTLESGHLTTRQHVQYTIQFAGISRKTIHDIFHAFPYYNTEQQSQRYVEAKNGNFLVPNDLTFEQQSEYLKIAENMNKAYFELLGALHPFVADRLASTHGKRKSFDNTVDKYCQEIARYVLPIAQHSNLFYTINELTLIRMFHASAQDSFSDEARFVIAKAIYEIYQVDPSILHELRKPVDNFERDVLKAGSEDEITYWQNFFDSELEGKNSKLYSSLKEERERVMELLSFFYPGIAGMKDNELLNLLVNPANNLNLANGMNIGIHDRFTQLLAQIHVNFITKMSHAAHSQSQRHRTTPSIVQGINSAYIGKADYFTPMVIAQNQELQVIYDQMMQRVYQGINDLINMGVSKETATYLLPNAHNVRVSETGNIFDWIHRWRQRLCYLAQEEIFFISLDQITQVLKDFPEMRPIVMAPCGLRHAAHTRPFCPEGSRFCGVSVWNFDIEDYARYRVI